MNIKKRNITGLEDIIKVQCSNGNWNYDPYMHGLANGLLLARHTILGVKEEIGFLDAPDKWLKDYPSIWTRIKWKIFKRPLCYFLSDDNKNKYMP